MQPIPTFGPLRVPSVVASYTPIIGGLIGFLVPIATLILWGVLMLNVVQGRDFKLSYVGEWAENHLQ